VRFRIVVERSQSDEVVVHAGRWRRRDGRGRGRNRRSRRTLLAGKRLTLPRIRRSAREYLTAPGTAKLPTELRKVYRHPLRTVRTLHLSGRRRGRCRLRSCFVRWDGGGGVFCTPMRRFLGRSRRCRIVSFLKRGNRKHHSATSATHLLTDVILPDRVVLPTLRATDLITHRASP
jgi:hypothetical protein